MNSYENHDSISLNSSSKEICFRQKLQRKSKHTVYVQHLFSGNAVYETMLKSMVQRAHR